jgi:hypothetical protein
MVGDAAGDSKSRNNPVFIYAQQSGYAKGPMNTFSIRNMTITGSRRCDYLYKCPINRSRMMETSMHIAHIRGLWVVRSHWCRRAQSLATPWWFKSVAETDARRRSDPCLRAQACIQNCLGSRTWEMRENSMLVFVNPTKFRNSGPIEVLKYWHDEDRRHSDARRAKHLALL